MYVDVYQSKNIWLYLQITRCHQAGYTCDCITSLVILLKNVLSLSMSVRQSRNGILIGIMWMIDFSDMSRLTDLIDTALTIPNVKLADPAIFLSSWIKLFSYCNTLS